MGAIVASTIYLRCLSNLPVKERNPMISLLRRVVLELMSLLIFKFYFYIGRKRT
jgi:hypothetical protein